MAHRPVASILPTRLPQGDRLYKIPMINPLSPNPAALIPALPRNPLASANDRRTPLTIAAIGGLCLFIAAVLRHTFLRSGAYDLGIFDQALYLISQGQAPFSTLIGMHMMADHVSLILYPLGWLYRLVPSVYLLLGLQTFAIAGSVIPIYYLCRQSKLTPHQSVGLSIVYLLNPITIFSALFDFNPYTLAIPFLIASVYFARAQRLVAFALCLAMVLVCRDAIALTVIFLGLWLMLFERRRRAGAIALISGLVWFGLATKVIVPLFVEPGSVDTLASIITRDYGYLGSSFEEILKNLVLHPDRWIKQLLKASVLKYLVLLTVPLAWGLSWHYFAPLTIAIPSLAMNLLATNEVFRTLNYHYNSPILIALMLAVIAAVAAQSTLIQKGRNMVIWSCLLIVLGGGARMATSNASSSFSWEQFGASRQAIAQVSPTGAVLTNHNLAPHVSARSVIHVYPVLPEFVPVFAQVNSLKHLTANDVDVTMYNQVLMRLGKTDWSADRNAARLVAQMRTDQRFALSYNNADVYLFTRRSAP
jgi:uncharacterized membrane protein